jgi:anti-sigma regulatory factor (Ser/Thr protein kinase)
VADSGPGLHDVTAGYVPPPDDLESGRGLWLARSLADDATVRPHGPGTAIRLYFHRHDVAGAGPAPAMAHFLR